MAVNKPHKPNQNSRPLAVVRGGGDIATGVVQALWRGGFWVCVLEAPQPLTIRRTVALSTAVAAGTATVEDMTARRVRAAGDCAAVWAAGDIPVLVDTGAECLSTLRPQCVVDAILAKRNLGTHPGMAPVTVALGPGFAAPHDADAVIETMRGHALGRIILQGTALPNTGVPGEVGGQSALRVIHAPAAGVVRHVRRIGDVVRQGDVLFTLGDVPVPSTLNGVLRGLIAEGLTVPKGMKCADVDPRPPEKVDCHGISDKARALGGAVLTACLLLGQQKGVLALDAVAPTE